MRGEAVIYRGPVIDRMDSTASYISLAKNPIPKEVCGLGACLRGVDKLSALTEEERDCIKEQAIKDYMTYHYTERAWR